jgi:hypothetical protein
MRRSIDFALVGGPPSDDDHPDLAWSVMIGDDYDDAEPRVLVVVEEQGRPAEGLTLHLSPDDARRLRAALGAALREIGEPAGG